MKKSIWLVLIGMALTFNVTAKKLYKWVDEDGNVSYSDQVPPDRIKKEHQELNDQGVVMDKVDKAKSKEYYQKLKEQQRLKKEQEVQAQKEEEKRQNLIKAYTNEDEIIRLKEERIYSIEKNIDSAKQNLVFQKKSLSDMQTIAANNERSGQKVSDALLKRIVAIEEKIKYQKKFIQVKYDELEKVKVKFDEDLERYRSAFTK